MSAQRAASASNGQTPGRLEVDGLVKRFGGVLATDRVALTVEPGSLHALIGPNGAGKTTLIAQLAGQLVPDAGRVRLDGTDITSLAPARRVRRGLVRTFQITSVFPTLSALDNVAYAEQARAGHSFRFLRRAAGDVRLVAPAAAQLERVGLASRAQSLAAELSHGERRQLEIAMALAARPSVLLLDEPMAGMSLDESQRMVELLDGLRGEVTILLVEHDMQAVFALADTLSVLDYGRLIATGAPDVVRANPAVLDAYLGPAG